MITMLIVLDRDGVINFESDEYIKSPDEWIPIPGSLAAIARLKAAGHTVVIATNQSGIARGLYTHEMLATIHVKMHRMLAEVGGAVDGVFYCAHHPDVHCDCRKPEPGLFYQIAAAHPVDWRNAVLVGDAIRDIIAAQRVGCRGVLVRTGRGNLHEDNARTFPEVEIYDDLADFADALLLKNG